MKKNNIGLLTIHSANSYGGILQAYATQQTLADLGVVQVLDYKTEHLKRSMQLFRTFDGPRSLLRVGKDIFRIAPRARLLGKFRRFSKLHLSLSSPISTERELIAAVRDLDAVVCGSDQIWNPKVTGGLDPAYFLGFPTKANKIAFSSSCGSYRFSNSEFERVSQWLTEFSAISVRESDTAKYMSAASSLNIEVTPDPTLLLGQEKWEHFYSGLEPVAESDYVFVYALKNSRILSEAINYLKKRTALKIVAVDQNPFRTYPADVQIRDAGPEDFLNALRGAKFVLTNSFHGTAFAVNFGIPFAVVEPETGRNRILSLLEDVGLTDHFIIQPDSIEKLLRKTVHSSATLGRLAQLRSHASRYLKGALAAQTS